MSTTVNTMKKVQQRIHLQRYRMWRILVPESLFVHYLQNCKRSFIIIISQTFVEIKNLIHEELQLFNSIKTHHISSTSTIMKDLYCLFPELFTFETKSNYYDLVFMGRFKKYCPCNLCLIITNSKRELRSLGRPAKLWSARFIR